ncbi:unnamed protein product [Calypogeia fissa]
MDEYQHMERFSMTNDYTDGQWIGGEFHYRKRKETHQQTKEEALYGIFEESDSDEEGTGKRRRRGDLIKKSDLTKPVNFVSTGIVRSVEEKVEEVAMEEDLDAAERPGLGLGMASSQTRKVEKVEEEIEDFLPTAFGRQIVESAQRKQKEREERERKVKVAAASGPTSGSDRVTAGVANLGTFEKHTRGIGMKLLEKMGYKGGGLGKNQQGIEAPIEAKLRPQKMGMGFKDFRESENGLGLTPPGQGEEPKDKVEKTKQKPKDKLWHVKSVHSKKSDHRTAAELLSEKQGAEPVQTVLDMRGPVTRVLTNLENLNVEQGAKQDDTPMPELQHNIRLIVDLVQSEIQISDKRLVHGKDQVVILEKETELLQNDLLSQKQQISILEKITSQIQNLQEKLSMGVMSLDTIAESFAIIKSKYREEYKMYNIGVIVLWFLMPATIAKFRGWEPLRTPQHGIEVISVLQGLLQDGEQQESIFQGVDSLYDGNSSPYTQLLMEAVIPAVRLAATNSWEPRDPEPMLAFLEAWDKLLPSSVLQHILENLVMPKLTVAVDNWDPRLETVPIHAWLHPWLLLLGTRMDPLYLPIRYKLTTALQAWHPKDTSAHTLLSPWQGVFDAGSWEQLLVRSILPKLIFALQELVINPAHQLLDQFNWVMAWATALPIHHMAGILETYFFPKWQQILYQWLCNNPNFEEITQWYLNWKSVFPSELLANERIRRQLNVALEMMNQAVEGAPVVQPGARENVSYLRVTEQREFELQQHAAYQQQQQHAAAIAQGTESNETENMSLKEIVEGFAQNNDVQFLPKLGRLHEGLQIYGFGMVSLCIDTAKQMLLVQKDDRWVSVTLEQLLEMHRTRSGSRWK